MNKKYHNHWLEDEKELVLSVTNEFQDLTSKFNQLIREIEHERDDKFRESEFNFIQNQQSQLDFLLEIEKQMELDGVLNNKNLFKQQRSMTFVP